MGPITPHSGKINQICMDRVRVCLRPFNLNLIEMFINNDRDGARKSQTGRKLIKSELRWTTNSIKKTTNKNIVAPPLRSSPRSQERRQRKKKKSPV